MRRRLDIDGLRAIAVVPVVLFHAGVGAFPGGFVGVDVFFVISGYLITSLIAGEIGEACFTLASFYERRIRRIFPALFAVIVASTVAAFILFMPLDLEDYGESVIATALFASNIYFYGETGYFDTPPDTKPLLHTWSLAIEEQFYIIFPLVLILAFRWGGRRWIGLVAIFFVLSLGASIWMTAVNPNAAFYLAPMRAWELMLGGLLAAGILPRIALQALRETAALAGVALIAYAVFAFSPLTPFPGWRALIPCFGAALLIYASEDEATSFVSRGLSLRPLVFIGLISYSLYLWHWPLLIFGRYWNMTALSGFQTATLIAASFVLAVLSWAYVEQPFRRRQIMISRRVLFAGAGAAIGLGLFLGAVPPVIGINRGGDDGVKDYASPNEATLRALESSPEIGTVLLVSRYARYIKGEYAAEHAGARVIVDGAGKELNLEDRYALFERQFDLTVSRLLTAGKTVVLVYPVPELGFAAPSVAARLMLAGRDPASLAVPIADFERRQDIVFAMFDRIDSGTQIIRIYPHKRLCDGTRCLAFANGAVLYRDDNHLSDAGAEFALPELESVFADRANPPPTTGVSAR